MKKRAFFARPAGICTLGSVLLLSVLLALRAGSVPMAWDGFIGGLFGRTGHEKDAIILYTLRMPRTLGAILAGVGLSVSGVLLQSVTGNALAGPNIIGVNAGAGFAVILTLALVPNSWAATPLTAAAGAFCTTVLIMAIASRMRSSRTAVILAGVAITALLNAGISLAGLLDNDVLASYNYFSIGGLDGTRIDRLLLPTIMIFAALGVSLLLSRRIDALCLGDGIAASLGIRVRALRVICLVLASVSASAVVSFAGLLGFVGLIVPHIARRLCGSPLHRQLPGAALLGAILVVLADLVGRTIFAPSEIPVGIVMAFIGAPFFIILLLRRKNDADV